MQVSGVYAETEGHVSVQNRPCHRQRQRLGVALVKLQFRIRRGKEEREKIIIDAVHVIEEKRKKKIAVAMHDDSKIIYDEFCATKKESSEICSNAELRSFLNSPLDIAKYKHIKNYMDPNYV